MYPNPSEFRQHLQNIITFRMTAKWANGNCHQEYIPTLLTPEDIISCASDSIEYLAQEEFDQDFTDINSENISIEDCNVAYFAGKYWFIL